MIPMSLKFMLCAKAKYRKNFYFSALCVTLLKITGSVILCMLYNETVQLVQKFQNSLPAHRKSTYRKIHDLKTQYVPFTYYLPNIEENKLLSGFKACFQINKNVFHFFLLNVNLLTEKYGFLGY